jgi:hypothetical protein
MEVPSKQEFQNLEQFAIELKSEVNRLKTALDNIEQMPKKWYLQSEATKFFIGRKGKPVDRHTFKKWVNGWIESGQLVHGVNINTVGNDGYIIREDFLKQTLKNNFKKAA